MEGPGGPGPNAGLDPGSTRPNHRSLREECDQICAQGAGKGSEQEGKQRWEDKEEAIPQACVWGARIRGMAVGRAMSGWV